MYRQYKCSVHSVDTLLEKSFSNLSVTDLNKNSDAREATEGHNGTTPETELPTLDHSVLTAVEKCWEEIALQCSQYEENQPYTQIPDDGDWKTLRVFVSSTFTDFFCEREILVKKVFPEFREWCQARKLYLVECDLRWGVPNDSTTALTISMCLDELDRSLAETGGQPLFLNLLGEKYGWCPSESDVPQDVKTKFNWVQGTSITFMEILHGAYRLKNPNALFMLRTESIIEHIPESMLSRYASTDALDVQHMKKLKAMLKSRFPDQVHHYDCQVEGMVQKHGKDMPNIVGLEKFAEQVLHFLKCAAERLYPDRDVVSTHQSRVLAEDANQKKFLEDAKNSLVARQEEAQLIWSFVEGDTSRLEKGEIGTPFARSVDFWHDLVTIDNNILCIQGQPGYGKTTLLAYVADKAIKSGYRVFYHFQGSTQEGHEVTLLLQRLLAFLSGDYSEESVEHLSQNYTNEDLAKKVRDLLVGMTKDTGAAQKVVIVIDALDVQTVPGLVNHLSWLPPHFPMNVRALVSTSNLDPPTLARIREYPYFLLHLDQLTKTDAKLIVTSFLSRFNKILDSGQLQTIVDSKCSESPLWLYLVCEELRIYGDFRTLTNHLKAITTSLEGTVDAIVERLVSEDDTGCMERALGLICCSIGQLTCLDLQRMLGNIEAQEPLASLTWASLRRNLQAYLRIADFNDVIMFVHDQMKQVVYRKLVQDKNCLEKYHKLFADYIEWWSDSRELKMHSLPHHFVAAKLNRRLVNFLRNTKEGGELPFFHRSGYFQRMRCNMLADPVIKGVQPAVICTFCKNSRSVYHPSRLFTNESMCVVCGNQTVRVPQLTKDAFYCHWHSVNIHPTMRKCCLCGGIADRSTVPAKLCSNCSFGNSGNQCCIVDPK